MHIAFELDQVHTPTAVAIGNFDGIHLGHQRVLQPILHSDRGIKTVLTFHPHPQTVFTGQPRFALTPPTEKQTYLKQLGLEQVVQLTFTPELAHQTPDQFMAEILVQALNTQHLSIGWDFCFGYQRSGTAETLKQWGLNHQIPVDIIAKTEWDGDRVSSSRIRTALDEGDIQTVNQLLGRAYQLSGVVIPGDQRGRELGFPTANLQLPPDKYLPLEGVYSCWVQLRQQRQPGILNIGYRPTFAGRDRRIEVHLLDWTGDLYGWELQVDLQGFIRPEQKFPSLQALTDQIRQDCHIARQQLHDCKDLGAQRWDLHPSMTELKP